MLIGYKRGQTSIVLRLKLLDSAVTTGAGKTGLTSSSTGLLISTIADNESSATVYAQASSNIETITTLGTYATPTASKCRFKEVDATNHKGVYEIQIADARFAVSSAKSLLISVSGVTGVAETDVVIPLTDLNVYDATRAGLTSLPNAAAEASGGLATLSAAQASNGTIPANVHRWLTGTPNALQSGRVDSYLGATASAVIASASFAADTGLVPARSNTAQAGASTSITLDASASSTTDFYKGCFIAITGSTGSGQTRLCTAYNGTTKVATVTPAWATNPTSSSTFAVIPGGSVDVQTINFTTQTARDIGASVLLSPGTGTGQLDITSGIPKANVTQFGGSAGTFSGGRPEANTTHIAGTAWASTTLFTLASHDPGTTLSSLTQTQVTGGAYPLSNASFAFASGLDFTTTQKTSIGTAVAASAVASVTGNVGGSVGSVASGGISRASFNADTGLQTIRSNTAASATGSTINLDASANANDGFYAGEIVLITGGTGAGQARYIRSYSGAGKSCAITPNWTTTPDNTSTFAILPHGSVDIATVGGDPDAGDGLYGMAFEYFNNSYISANAWDIPTTGHATSGTFGEAMAAAGSAGDPWTTALPGSYTAGQAGYILGNNLNATISSRMATFTLPTNFSSLVITAGGIVDADIETIKGQAVTCAAGVTVLASVGTASTSTAQTGDSYARLGAPAGASVSADVAAVKTDTGNLVTRITSTLFSGITSLAQWLGAMAGKQTGNSTALTEIRAAGAGSGTFDPTTDSIEAIRDYASPASTALSTATWTGTRAGYLDNLSAGAVAQASALSTVNTNLNSLITTVGTAGVGLTNIPWNAAWDAEVQSECADALTAYGASTYAGADTSGTTTLLSRLSATRAGYLDNLSAGAVAQASALSTVGTNVSALITTVGTAGDGLTALAQASIWTSTIAGRIDAAVSSRMATYSQPTGFLAATFPVAVASTTNITSASGVTLTSAYDAAKTAATQASVDLLPTADENASALFEMTNGVEGGLTFRDYLRLTFAALAGTSSGLPGGPIVFTSKDGSKERITATFDSDSNRVSITYDPS